MQHEDPVDPELDAAWELFEDGLPAEALERLEARADAATGAPLATLCWLELGELGRAGDALASASSATDPFERSFAEAALHLAAWRIPAARDIYAELVASEPDDPDLVERLSLCADLLGDHVEADRLMRTAHRLDPDAFPLPVRLERNSFMTVVDHAARWLPDDFRAALDEVQVIVDDVPTAELLNLAHIEELGDTPPDMLGLFYGPTDLDGGWSAACEGGFSHGLPPTIWLFKRNLERASPDRVTLEREIAITLYHELAHKLGFDEDEVDEMGLA